MIGFKICEYYNKILGKGKKDVLKEVLNNWYIVYYLVNEI